MQIFISIALPILLMLNAPLTQKGKPYKAKIETELQENFLTAKSTFTNHSDSEVRFTYQLKSKKSGTSGMNTNNQSGNVHAAPGQTVILSKTSFNVHPADKYSLYLEIRDKEMIVAQDSILFPDTELH